MTEARPVVTRCVLCAAPLDSGGGERPVCGRCREGLGGAEGAEAVGEKLAQLGNFGLGASAGPLLKKPSAKGSP